MIDLTSISDDTVYDAMVRELTRSDAYGVTTATRPGAPLVSADINEASIRRMAFLLLHGVRVYSDGGPWRVLGAGGEAVAGPWDGQPLPRTAYLSSDLRGHVEIHRTVKVAYRQCKNCRSNFVVTRPRSVTARWAEYCGADCKRVQHAANKRARRAER